MIIANHLLPARHVSGVRGVIFDCDGVMVDSMGANIWYYNLFKREFGLEPMTPEEEHFVHIHNVYASLEHILPEGTWEAAAEFRARLDYREVLPHIRMEPGLESLVTWLRSAGYRLAVNTSRTNTMDMLLSHLGLENVFNPVVTTVSVRFPKPHPEGVFQILAAWGASPEEVVYIGDSSVDERTARSAGIPFWAYKNQLLDADLHVSDFFTLKSVLMRAGGMTASS